MCPHDKARWLRPVDPNAAVTEIPPSNPWKYDCGESVPSTIDGIEVDAEALCYECVVELELGLMW